MNQSCSVASSLHPLHRQQLAMKVLSKQEPISHLAKQEQVSRKFLYQQKEIAERAFKTAFDKPEKEREVLYYLPVTQQWLFQLILALILICHCSSTRYQRAPCEICLTIRLVLAQFTIG